MPQAKRKSNRTHKKLRYQDLVSTRPGSLAGTFMRRFWHPIHRAEELRAGQAKPIEIMSERFTLYRGDNGAPHVVDFRCPHRGTQLSAGWVEGDSIRCMYHGWLFNGAGQCTDQPAEEKSFAAKIRIRSYPTREYLGLIFAYFGAGEAPPFPVYPHMEEEGVLEVLSTEVWPCNFFQRIDNNGDTYHVPFVHRGAYSASAPIIAAACRRFPKKKAPGERRRTRVSLKAGATFFTSSCPTFTRFEIRRPNRSVGRRTACNGMCRSMISTRWNFACGACRSAAQPRINTARAVMPRPRSQKFPLCKWARPCCRAS